MSHDPAFFQILDGWGRPNPSGKLPRNFGPPS